MNNKSRIFQNFPIDKMTKNRSATVAISVFTSTNIVHTRANSIQHRLIENEEIKRKKNNKMHDNLLKQEMIHKYTLNFYTTTKQQRKYIRI